MLRVGEGDGSKRRGSKVHRPSRQPIVLCKSAVGADGEQHAMSMHRGCVGIYSDAQPVRFPIAREERLDVGALRSSLLTQRLSFSVEGPQNLPDWALNDSYTDPLLGRQSRCSSSRIRDPAISTTEHDGTPSQSPLKARTSSSSRCSCQAETCRTASLATTGGRGEGQWPQCLQASPTASLIASNRVAASGDRLSCSIRAVRTCGRTELPLGSERSASRLA